MEPPKRAAAYLRISEDKDLDELGVSRQREDAEELVIKARGWTHVHTYVENDTSAAGKVKRPEWLAMMASIERGELDVVVGWTMDRTLRSGRDRLRMLELGKTHGITIALVRGNDMDLSTPSGRMTADILGAVALNEIEVKSDRQKRAAVQRAELGKPWASRRPFGYEPGGMVIREAEAGLIRTAYADVLAGASVRGIAGRWNDAGVATSTGARWSGASVTQMLRSARYAAIRTYGRDKLRREVGPATWPAIVSEDTWRAAVAVLTDPDRHIGATRERVYLLSGLAICGLCQRPMSSGQSTSTRKPVYVCKAKQHLSRSAAHVDALVRAVVVKRLSRPDARELLVDDTRPDAEPLRREALALRTRRDELAADRADGLITRSQLLAGTKKITARLKVIDGQLVSVSRAPVLADLIGVEDVGRAFDALPLDRQRAVITALVVVTILPTGRGRTFRPESVKIEPAL